MTANEVKFALQIEAIFNKITQPEYRQLMVEAIMILCLLVQHDSGGRCRWNEIIVVDKLVQRANEIFIKEQVCVCKCVCGVSTHNRLGGGGSGVAQVLEGWPHLSGVHGSRNRC
jgi:hypothetical protein